MACLSPPAFANVPRRMLLCDISEEAFDKIELECTRWCEERMETAMLATQRFTASVLARGNCPEPLASSRSHVLITFTNLRRTFRQVADFTADPSARRKLCDHS